MRRRFCASAFSDLAGLPAQLKLPAAMMDSKQKAVVPAQSPPATHPKDTSTQGSPKSHQSGQNPPRPLVAKATSPAATLLGQRTSKLQQRLRLEEAQALLTVLTAQILAQTTLRNMAQGTSVSSCLPLSQSLGALASGSDATPKLAGAVVMSPSRAATKHSEAQSATGTSAPQTVSKSDQVVQKPAAVASALHGMSSPGPSQRAVLATPLRIESVQSLAPDPELQSAKRLRLAAEEPLHVQTARLINTSRNILQVPPTATAPQSLSKVASASIPGVPLLSLPTISLSQPPGTPQESSTGFPVMATPFTNANTGPDEIPKAFPLLVTPPAEMLVPESVTRVSNPRALGGSGGTETQVANLLGRIGGTEGTEGGGRASEDNGREGEGVGRKKKGRRGKKRAKEEQEEEEQRNLLARLASLSEETLCKLTQQVMMETRAKQQHAEQAEKEDPTKLFQCGLCLEMFESPEIFREHVDQEHSPYHCTYCSAALSSPSALQDHVDNSHNPFKCGFCQEGFMDVNELEAHISNCSANKCYRCHRCKKNFQSLEILTVHTEVHTTGIHRCWICQKAFKAAGNLRKHNMTHTGEKPFKCDECDSAFICKQHLVRHKYTHSKQRPFPCPYCPRTFVQPLDVRRHLRTHTGEKPFHCEKCDKSFTRLQHYKRHLETPSHLHGWKGKKDGTSSGAGDPGNSGGRKSRQNASVPMETEGDLDMPPGEVSTPPGDDASNDSTAADSVLECEATSTIPPSTSFKTGSNSSLPGSSTSTTVSNNTPTSVAPNSNSCPAKASRAPAAPGPTTRTQPTQSRAPAAPGPTTRTQPTESRAPSAPGPTTRTQPTQSRAPAAPGPTTRTQPTQSRAPAAPGPTTRTQPAQSRAPTASSPTTHTQLTKTPQGKTAATPRPASSGTRTQVSTGQTKTPTVTASITQSHSLPTPPQTTVALRTPTNTVQLCPSTTQSCPNTIQSQTKGPSLPISLTGTPTRTSQANTNQSHANTSCNKITAKQPQLVVNRVNRPK